MARKVDIENIARISAGANGYYITAEVEGHIDERGTAYPTKANARRAAKAAGYTHAVGSGVNGAALTKTGKLKPQKL